MHKVSLARHIANALDPLCYERIGNPNNTKVLALNVSIIERSTLIYVITGSQCSVFLDYDTRSGII